MTTRINPRPPLCRCLCAAAFAAVLAGCGARGFAPDSVIEKPGPEQFLDQVGKACGNLNLGTADVNARLQSQDDTYFVDETSKLWYGDVSRDQYQSDITAFYPGGDSAQVVECIFGQLPTGL